MFPLLLDYVIKQHYDIIEKHPPPEQGIDIVATKDGKKAYFELKGDTANSYADFGTLLYQILRYVKDDPFEEYTIAVSNELRQRALQVRYSLSKLGVKAVVISESGVEPLF